MVFGIIASTQLYFSRDNAVCVFVHIADCVRVLVVCVCVCEETPF